MLQPLYPQKNKPSTHCTGGQYTVTWNYLYYFTYSPPVSQYVGYMLSYAFLGQRPNQFCLCSSCFSQASLHTCTAPSQVPLFWYKFTPSYEVKPQFSVHYHHTLRHTIHQTVTDLNHNIRDDDILYTFIMSVIHYICTITHTPKEVQWYLAVTPLTYNY
jgi:hypothetical protein